MGSPLVVRGTFVNGTFVPFDPLPDAEGPAELIIHSPPGKDSRPSVYDAFGKSRQPRTAEELDAQLRDEREAWGEP
mgnify:CR=1 FL=1